MTLPCRVEVDLPHGWHCFELEEPSDALSSWLLARGARLALLRTADEALPAAICGGVFLLDEPVAGDVLYSALDADGQAVALGDLDGIPITAHLRCEPRGSQSSPAVLVTYFICAPCGCVVISFMAEFGDVTRVVREVARVISAVRVVQSAN